MKIVKLTPAVKDYIWGGEKLKNYGKTAEGIIAESWELSFHKDGLCLTPDGVPLRDAVTSEELGVNIKDFEFFPTLIKFIDAKQNLSVQVHPSDSYSLENEGQLGKTEMWYIVDADEGAGIYMGFKTAVSKEQFAEAIDKNTICELLNFIQVKKGEHYFIKSGTVHAIGAGTTICEIQQNSNVTYRVYDYDRRDAFGNARELHIEKAMAVSDLTSSSPICPRFNEGNKTRIALSKYFTAHEQVVSGESDLFVDNRSFCVISATYGEGTIDGEPIKAGDSMFVPAGYGSVKVDGNFTALLTTVRQYFALAKRTNNGYSITLKDDLDVEIYVGEGEGGLTQAINSAFSSIGIDVNDLAGIEVEYQNEIKIKR